MGRKKKSGGFFKMLGDAFAGHGPVSKRGRKVVKKAGVSEIFGFKL